MQRGNVLLKQGKLDEALLDFNEVVSKHYFLFFPFLFFAFFHLYIKKKIDSVEKA